jgi:hypothetical protein
MHTLETSTPIVTLRVEATPIVTNFQAQAFPIHLHADLGLFRAGVTGYIGGDLFEQEE